MLSYGFRIKVSVYHIPELSEPKQESQNFEIKIDDELSNGNELGMLDEGFSNYTVVADDFDADPCGDFSVSDADSKYGVLTVDEGIQKKKAKRLKEGKEGSLKRKRIGKESVKRFSSKGKG